MRNTYFEELEQLASREAGRTMIFTALKSRGANSGPGGKLAALGWLFGVDQRTHSKREAEPMFTPRPQPKQAGKRLEHR